MSKKYTSPEHQIRNILSESGSSVKSIIKGFKDLKDVEIEDILPFPSLKKSENLPTVVPDKGATADALQNFTAPKVETPPATTTAPKVDNLPATATAPKVQPEVDLKTQTQVAPKVDNLPATKTQTQVSPKVQGETPTPPKRGEAPKRAESPKRSILPFGLTPGQPIALTAGSVFDVNDYLHMAKTRTPDLDAPIHEETSDEERKKIENVARPNSDRNKVMARNESIKKKIIDENVKKKAIIKDAINDKYSKSVEISPEIKSEKMNESKSALGLGAGMYTANDSIPKANEYIAGKLGLEPRKRELTAFEGGTDLALDVASMIPIVGAVPSLINAGRRAARGDYADALVDVAGVIPGVKWLTTPMKYGGKAITAGAKITPPIARAADVVSGGKNIPTSGVLAGTKTGKAIDKTADTIERNVTSPANMFQIGGAADALTQEFTGKKTKEHVDPVVSNVYKKITNEKR